MSRVLTRLYDDALRPSGLRVSQLTVLVAIAKFGEPGAKIGRLADVLAMERTTLTRNIGPLEAAGLLRVARDPEDARARILVLTVDDEWVAATVDGVLDVSVLDAARLAPPPTLFRGLAASYLRGVVRRGERLVIFLDVPRLFSTDERIVLERPSEEPARNA